MAITEAPDYATQRDEVSDEMVIELIRAGNTHAYEIIMRRYNQRLYRAARSILNDDDTAQDAMQQAYISAYYKLDTFAPTGSFGAWLTKITINESLMIKRKPDNRATNVNRALENDSIEQTDGKPDTVLANTELAALIETAVEKLPNDYRSVFILRAVQQLSIKETADSLGIYEATVKTRFHRARKLMQQTLNQHIEQADMQVFEFAGQRCDYIVYSVFKRLGVMPETNYNIIQTRN